MQKNGKIWHYIITTFKQTSINIKALFMNWDFNEVAFINDKMITSK